MLGSTDNLLDDYRESVSVKCLSYAAGLLPLSEMKFIVHMPIISAILCSPFSRLTYISLVYRWMSKGISLQRVLCHIVSRNHRHPVAFLYLDWSRAESHSCNSLPFLAIFDSGTGVT